MANNPGNFGGRRERSGSEWQGGEERRWQGTERAGSAPYSFTDSSRIREKYRGQGPKGYRRSDERLTEIICERLLEDPDIDASDISVQVRDQQVTLTGSVSSRWIKYRVEDVVEQATGVAERDNRLRVDPRRQYGVFDAGAEGTPIRGTGQDAASYQGVGTARESDTDARIDIDEKDADIERRERDIR